MGMSSPNQPPPKGIPAIETRYGGYRFRSRLEARWAVFFDSLDVDWDYEREGYDLGEAGWYLPDFWLPELGCWVEVKPSHPPDADTIRKAAALRDQEGSPVVIFSGPVRHGTWLCFAHDIGHACGGASEWSVRWFVCDCGKPKLSWGDGCHHIVNGSTWTGLPMWCTLKPFFRSDACGPGWSSCAGFGAEWIYRAVDMARGARFEYGEHGATI
jgi:hypothetical protein